MRKDMSKKIVESPCHGGGKEATKRDRARLRDSSIESLEDSPKRESIRRKHRAWWSGKDLVKNLNPLFRYLNKQKNRPWDDVYSEIRQEIKMDSKANDYILNAISFIVEQKVIMKDGVPYYSNPSFWRLADRENLPIVSYSNGSYNQMYVDPDTGILKMAPQREERAKRKRDSDILYDDNDNLIQYHRIKGIWYEIKFREMEDKDIRNRNPETQEMLPEWNWRVTCSDILDPDQSYSKSHLYSPYIREWERHYGSRIVPINKRQMNSKEIKQLEDGE